MREYFLRSPCLYEFNTCPQGYCSGGIYCAAFESVREEVRLLQAFAGAAGAALHECFQRVFSIGQHESGAHGAVKPLVSGGADDVYSVLQAQRKQPCSLGGVHYEADVFAAAEVRKLRQRHSLTGDISGGGADERHRFRAYCPGGVHHGLPRLGGAFEQGVSYSAFRQGMHRADNRIVLDVAQHKMRTGARKSLYRDIQRMGAVKGEHRVFRLGAEEF